MSNSLSEQLLKAGLITQEQITQAEQARQQQKEKAKARQNPKPAPGKPKARPAEAKPKEARAPNKAPNPPDSKPATSREASDLEQFYRERDNLERQEKAAEEQRRREAAERKKKTRKQVRELIASNLMNVEDAAERYNFAVGDTVKYLYVTEQQQQALAEGQLAITFMDGKRCLIPTEVGEQVLALDPEKLVVFNKPDGGTLAE